MPVREACISTHIYIYIYGCVCMYVCMYVGFHLSVQLKNVQVVGLFQRRLQGPFVRAFYLAKDVLPGPAAKNDDLDLGLSDFELFQKYCLPNMDRNGTDLWHQANCPKPCGPLVGKEGV